MPDLFDRNYSAKGNLGLSQKRAEEKLKENGKNILAKEKKSKPLKIFLGQFKDVMVMILLGATVVSVFLGEIYDAVTIILIVLVNAVLGFIQEYRTEKTIEALNRMTAPAARCWRDGILKSIPASELVADDIIELEAGDRVPADCVLLSSKGLMADEAVLTGEAVAVEKRAGIPEDKDNSLNRPTVAYGGTVITKGRGRGKIIAAGLNSQMGKISGMLSEIEEPQTPLQVRLSELGRIIAVICLAVCVIVFSAGVLRGEPVFSMLLTGISIAIAAIPEGLPATVTIALALAVSRMLKQKALVHRLHSVETLGCTSVICTDKTGTITENKMTVKKIFSGLKLFDVTGNGNRIAGEIKLDGLGFNPKSSPSVTKLLTSAVLCNNGTITADREITSRERGRLTMGGDWKADGDPTETALLIAAAKGGITAGSLQSEYSKTDEIPFDSETRMMTVFARNAAGRTTAFIKGAPDVIISRCSAIMTDDGIKPMSRLIKKQLADQFDQLSGEALRVLAFAEKETGNASETLGGLVFLGFMGMLDPPRPEAKRAVKTCAEAHIKTVMITGDYKNTAVAIARQAGILKGSEEGRVLTGEELSSLSDEELSGCIEAVCVYARVNPSDKLRIVKALKQKGKIVTMTGDGVNDAPAIKEAHIGVSMGLTGTDVTKQAADVILLDDNFATLVNAVGQGRTIYANIRKFVRYLLSCNIGEVITMFLGILMGLPLVLLPTQILLVNLITDGLPAIALGLEPEEKSFMKKRPRSPSESFFSGGLMSQIVFRGIFIGLSTLGCFTTLLNSTGSLEIARTGALFTLVVSQLIHVFECKSEEKTLFTIPYFNNFKLILAVFASALVIAAAIYLPALQLVFSTLPLNQEQLLVSAGFSAAVPFFCSIIGLFRKKRN